MIQNLKQIFGNIEVEEKLSGSEDFGVKVSVTKAEACVPLRRVPKTRFEEVENFRKKS